MSGAELEKQALVEALKILLDQLIPAVSKRSADVAAAAYADGLFDAAADHDGVLEQGSFERRAVYAQRVRDVFLDEIQQLIDHINVAISIPYPTSEGRPA